MQKLIESDKTYQFIDFIKIPFAVCPMATVVKITNKVLSAFIPTIQLLVTAKFIDTPIAIFGGNHAAGQHLLAAYSANVDYCLYLFELGIYEQNQSEIWNETY